MSVFRDGGELQDQLVAFLEAFLASPEGAAVAERVRAAAPEAIVRLATRDPETAVTVDFERRAVARGGGEGATAAEVIADADALHHFWLGHLEPVEISQLVESGVIQVDASPAALAALVPVVGAMEPYYRRALADGGRADLIAAPAPSTRQVWRKEGPPAELIGAKRTWQRAST